MKRATFVILAATLMLLVGIYVRAGVEQPAPQAQGPRVPHSIQGMENCLGCHGNIRASHDAMFGRGNYDKCLDCHRQQ